MISQDDVRHSFFDTIPETVFADTVAIFEEGMGVLLHHCRTKILIVIRAYICIYNAFKRIARQLIYNDYIFIFFIAQVHLVIFSFPSSDVFLILLDVAISPRLTSPEERLGYLGMLCSV